MADPVRVFVSHHHSPQENAFTTQLVERLQAAGADVWVDTERIPSGDFVRKISEGLAGRQWLVLVMTPDALQSPWVQSEVNAALHQVNAGRMLGIIPIVAAPCPEEEVPLLWANLHRYDATHDAERAVAGVLRAMGLSAPMAPPSPPSPPMQAPPVPEPIKPNSPLPEQHPSAGLTRNWHPFIAILAAVLVVGLLAVLFSAVLSPGQSHAGNGSNTSATTAARMTAEAHAVSTFDAQATRDAAKIVHFPYVAPAPGPGCDRGVARWSSTVGVSVSCASNPTRTHVVLTCGSSSGCGGNVYLATDGFAFTLQGSFTVGVDVSGMSSDASVDLHVNNYALMLEPGGYYLMSHAGRTVAQGSVNASMKTSLAIGVTGSGVSGSVNGTVVATVPDANMAASGASYISLDLDISGPSGAYADFANFHITQP